jgi:beta-hydroxylase
MKSFVGWSVLLVAVAVIVIIVITMRKDCKRKCQTVKEYINQPGNYFTAPLNNYVERNSLDQTSPIIDISNRPELVNDFKLNWKAIRDEGLKAINKMTPIKGDLFFKDTIIKDENWKKMYLKWYGPIEEEMEKEFPITTSIIKSHPEIHLAMFSLLKSGGRIYPHAGPFRGSIRVHLGLQTPNDDNCYIMIGNEKYSWRDGELVAFDDTYRHEVANNTNQDRLILFLDIERKMNTKMSSSLNKFLIDKIAPITSRTNSKLEKVVL